MKASELIREIQLIKDEEGIDDFEIGIQGVYEMGLCDYPLPVSDTGFMSFPFPNNLYAIGVNGYDFLKNSGIDLLDPDSQIFSVDVYACHSDRCDFKCFVAIRGNKSPPSVCINNTRYKPEWEKTDSNITLLKQIYEHHNE